MMATARSMKFAFFDISWLLLFIMISLLAVTTATAATSSSSSTDHHHHHQQQQQPYRVDFFHHIEDTNLEIDLIRILKSSNDDDDKEEECIEIVKENLVRGQTIGVMTNGPGEIFRAIISTGEASSPTTTSSSSTMGTDPETSSVTITSTTTEEIYVISEITIVEDRHRYEITPRNTATTTYVEPTVNLHKSVLPPHICQKLIDMGNEIGWHHEDFESIDANYPKHQQQPVAAIDVMNGLDVYYPQLMEVIEPYIPKITQLVLQDRDPIAHAKYFPNNTMPQLDWVFFRIYKPNERHSLQPHADSNMHTVTISLNTDYEGGGIYYIKPPVFLQHLWDGPDPDTGRDYILPQYRSYDYNDQIQRQPFDESTADTISPADHPDVVFPIFEVGDALIYNYTIYHGIAPITSGARYSFVFFYDMDNPVVQDELEIAAIESEKGGEGAVHVSFVNRLNTRIDLIWRLDDEEEAQAARSTVQPKEIADYVAYVDDIVVAIDTESGETIKEFVLAEGRNHYEITDFDLEDEHNGKEEEL